MEGTTICTPKLPDILYLTKFLNIKTILRKISKSFDYPAFTVPLSVFRGCLPCFTILLTLTESNVIRLVRESGLQRVLAILDSWEKVERRHQVKLIRGILSTLSHVCDSSELLLLGIWGPCLGFWRPCRNRYKPTSTKAITNKTIMINYPKM